MNYPETSPAVVSFREHTDVRLAEIEAALRRVLPKPGEGPAPLLEAMRYSVESGGKRLRPLLTLVAAEAVAESLGHESPDRLAAVRQLAMPAACAIELIHTYSLVHDDLPAMDNDVMRRGRPTLHVVYGEALAMLASDALLVQAFTLLATEPHGDDPTLMPRKLQVLQRVGQASGWSGMAGGQAIDLAHGRAIPGLLDRLAPLDVHGLRDMHQRKTGRLIRAAAVAGAIMAGGNEVHIQALDRFAAELGLVFQIIDDILDVEGTTETLGKTAGKDAAQCKPTYPALVGLAQSRQFAAEGLARAEASLDEADLPAQRLREVAAWLVNRRC